MLGAIAAIALILGSLSAAVSVTGGDQQPIEESGAPTAEVQVVESADSTFD